MSLIYSLMSTLILMPNSQMTNRVFLQISLNRSKINALETISVSLPLSNALEEECSLTIHSLLG
jgi:hypothetical protein